MKIKTNNFIALSFLAFFYMIQQNIHAESDVTSYIVRAYAPNASTAHISGLGGTWGLPGIEVDMTPIVDNLWEAEISPVTPGFHYYNLVVNGIITLNPLHKFYSASSNASNGIEIPDPDSAFYSIQDVPHGTVRMHYYIYKTTKRSIVRRCMIYLPPGYDARDSKTYPILYLQHGNGENELSWSQQGQVANIIDNLISEGKAEPMIVVMENGMTLDFVWLFSHGLQAEIEGKYKVNTNREYRAAAGLSMGGSNAGNLAVNGQSTFSSLGIFSSWIDVANPQLFQQTNQNFVLFWLGWGEQDEYYNDESYFHSQLNTYRVNHEATVYPGGHEWQVWRKCLRDFSQLLFKPYTYTNPFSDIKTENTKALTVYPNPFSEQINVTIPEDMDGQVIQVVVTDILGHIIHSANWQSQELQQKLNESLSNVPCGVYNLRINTIENSYSSKIIKTN
jgi:enterochelin esterase-like enzyme